MSWTAPMTAVAGAAFTAAQYNLYNRDNLNETGPSKATTAGRLLVTTGVNSITERIIANDSVAADQTTTNTSYVDLATVGPTLSTIPTGTMALLYWSAYQYNATNSARSFMGVAVSGASSVAASDNTALGFESQGTSQINQHGIVQLFTGLTGGNNTFQAKYRAETGTAGHRRRFLGIIAL